MSFVTLVVTKTRRSPGEGNGGRAKKETRNSAEGNLTYARQSGLLSNSKGHQNDALIDRDGVGWNEEQEKVCALHTRGTVDKFLHIDWVRTNLTQGPLAP